MTHHRHLLSPLDLRGQRLRNRIVFGAHTNNMAENGLPGARTGAYLLERALGGAAMIVAEPMPVHRTAVLTRGNYRHDSDAVIAPFRAITEPVRDAGAVILQQLYHTGAHGDSDLSFAPHWSPSGHASYHDSDGSHRMTEAEIEEIIEGHVRAALRCQQAGFQGVEVWAAYHSLLDQFWTPWSNTRDDRWGGSLENRTRLSRTIIERIRRACGEDFLIGLAVSTSDAQTVTLSVESLLEITALHDASGHVDYITCGHGGYLDFERLMPTFLYGEKLTAPVTEQMKAVVKHAKIISEAHVRTPENAEAVIAAGQADLVSIVRGQIADPHLARKVAEGRAEDVRGCISCNQMCWGRRSRDYWISCLINPSAGREFEWGGDRFTPAEMPQDVLVVGAGPAGLEAARVAAERGHRVEIVEAGSQIGGQFRLAGMQPRRGQILELFDWYERQFTRLGVTLRLNTFLEADEIAAHPAPVVVLATGSLPDPEAGQRWLPAEPELPGLARGNVWSAEEAMRREARLGETVLLYDEGGSWRGVGTAWTLAERGHRVVLATPDPYVGREITRTSADGPARARLAKLGARMIPEHVIAAWHGDGATLRSLLTGAEDRIEASALVMATTNIAFDPCPETLPGKVLHRIGDCATPRQAPFAFHDGRACGRAL
ncbi:2,4-dienoyl-CoA reductase-like NADH-dependent reductase (Old Yellow Enzyme family) [Rhodobacter viridis]|uniref:2,4-dienoyl-CoA reductase-like NADH-dependent reductase (Old Yellow Enzyme family) n=1 Tax=Rhodobacter viridis TaxID=1054202 RepID=A0A318TTK6_9RHOB|nr:FAD-dependent oxidoreductase [Rhodobacter viridis]PYF08176.1 2,4-dienoyl-CoA reductase-like NADH-dependent reductase (Old Yellow Enzyme family) [Rhodobacter viridis]